MYQHVSRWFNTCQLTPSHGENTGSSPVGSAIGNFIRMDFAASVRAFLHGAAVLHLVCFVARASANTLGFRSLTHRSLTHCAFARAFGLDGLFEPSDQASATIVRRCIFERHLPCRQCNTETILACARRNVIVGAPNDGSTEVTSPFSMPTASN